MRLYAALLTSLLLHLALIAGPEWLSAGTAPTPKPRIEVKLPPLLDEQTTDPVEQLSTEPAVAPSTQPLPTAPRPLRGEPLRRAEAALTRHLLYPPEAIARGLEGEVILLLATDSQGRLVAVDIARSSGHPLLDRAAVDAARHIGHLPGTKRQMLFPVTFRLQ